MFAHGALSHSCGTMHHPLPRITFAILVFPVAGGGPGDPPGPRCQVASVDYYQDAFDSYLTEREAVRGRQEMPASRGPLCRQGPGAQGVVAGPGPGGMSDRAGLGQGRVNRPPGSAPGSLKPFQVARLGTPREDLHISSSSRSIFWGRDVSMWSLRPTLELTDDFHLPA